MKKFYKTLLVTSWCILSLTSCGEHQSKISVFPLENYSQNIADWIKPSAADYDKPLLDYNVQQDRLTVLYRHLFGTSSPWNKEYVKKVLHTDSGDNIKSNELSLIAIYDNQNKPASKIGYGENFRPHSQSWIKAIAENINTAQFENLTYNPAQRAIAIDNLHARALPTDDVFFYHHRIPGQGYPFDNLQMSSLWVGTPVYILGETRDHAWSLVITPDFIAWVKTTGIARTSNNFITTWQNSAKKHLAGITQTKTSIVDTNGTYRFASYIGAIYPATSQTKSIRIMIPIADVTQHALIRYAEVPKTAAAMMPLTATPHHFSEMMSTLLGRPYGWGNMYFYNDCSAELKNLLAPFGFWLPRHSSDQIYAGKVIDVSKGTSAQRINYLMQNGHRFLTLVYIGGHILMYIGNYPNPNSKDHELMAMTFQNMWGLSPKPPKRRAVIGGSVLFPMLEKFPEDRHLASQASKTYFQISHLDEASSNLLKLQIIDLKELMYP